jgi:hypothetical protein
MQADLHNQGEKEDPAVRAALEMALRRLKNMTAQLSDAANLAIAQPGDATVNSLQAVIGQVGCSSPYCLVISVPLLAWLFLNSLSLKLFMWLSDVLAPHWSSFLCSGPWRVTQR